jgi:hypothetical protein
VLKKSWYWSLRVLAAQRKEVFYPAARAKKPSYVKIMRAIIENKKDFSTGKSSEIIPSTNN